MIYAILDLHSAYSNYNVMQSESILYPFNTLTSWLSGMVMFWKHLFLSLLPISFIYLFLCRQAEKPVFSLFIYSLLAGGWYKWMSVIAISY